MDEPSGRVPLPDEGEVRIARSVQLSSAELGLVTKVDLLEGGPDGTVVPVETKRGSSPDNPERSWEPERVQVCVQALLLRAHGYVVDHGVTYFAETRERVIVPIDDVIITRTLELVRGLRVVAASTVPPPPLVDSPKCPRCSLVGICLPDETNTLAERAAMSSRRLIPSDDAPKPLYVTEQGAWATKSNPVPSGIGPIAAMTRPRRCASPRSLRSLRGSAPLQPRRRSGSLQRTGRGSPVPSGIGPIAATW